MSSLKKNPTFIFLMAAYAGFAEYFKSLRLKAIA